MSRFVKCIKEAQKRGYLNECFTAKDVKKAFKKLCEESNICCDFSEATFSTFLSKHRRGNPGRYEEYFEECGRGRYRLINRGNHRGIE